MKAVFYTLLSPLRPWGYYQVEYLLFDIVRKTADLSRSRSKQNVHSAPSCDRYSQ